MEVNRKLDITGVVQGVGFRPFVYQLAYRYDLKGFVENNSRGVTLEVEGKKHDVEAFIKDLQSELPPLAYIDTIESSEASYMGYPDFKILQSKTQKEKSALVSADIAICDNCLQEMYDPTNRRYQYPFINCTDCGPRYSIIKTVPYDRPNTSMCFFKMCKACHEEYMDPFDRRFHAQPISCPECGPTLSLLDTENIIVAKDNNAVALAVNAIMKGKIIAVKGLGGFHLICDATNSEVVVELRKRKQRPLKPFAVMFPDMKMIRVSTQLSSDEEALITSKEKPIVIVQKCSDTFISESVAPKIDRIGVFLPYMPLHQLLLKELALPLVATSANRSDEPIIRNSSELIEKLGNIVDLVLDHDRNILNANDDSVVQMAGDKKITLRMARGYAPKSLKLPFKSKKKILAVGANQKNCIAMVFEDTLIISPHIGDLNSLEAFEYFERTIESFKRFYDFEPDVIVCDKHPNYDTTKWAKKQDTKLVGVGHHLAHIYACKAEFGLDGDYLGFSFDGTGFGDDGTLWGGEVFVGDERKYSFKPIKLLGGERAIKEPRRVALAMLFERFSYEEVSGMDTPTVNSFSKSELSLLHQSYVKELNAPKSSSVGRIFDAIASFTDLLQFQTYEGEAGLRCEQEYNLGITQSFRYEIVEGVIEIGFDFFAKDLVSLFMNTLVKIVVDIAKIESIEVILSGGVFQNRTLLELIMKELKDENIPYYYQRETPINDGGIALGQLYWYLSQKNY